MEKRWTVYVQREGSAKRVPLVRFRRPVDTATVSDFGLSIAEGRLLLRALQTAVAQDQVVAYDLQRRHCRHCGAYRRIKDWRPRVFATGLGEIRIRVPRVVSCLCSPEPLDDQDEPRDLRYSECSIETLLPSRRTPEVSYLCAKHGASSSYRTAAQHVVAIAGLRGLSHASVRKETVRCGELIEDAQFHVGWFAGGRKQAGAEHLRVAIDGTVLTATPSQEVSKFEVIAGRVERDGYIGRRFVCAEPRRTLTRVLVAAALEQSGWTQLRLSMSSQTEQGECVLWSQESRLGWPPRFWIGSLGDEAARREVTHLCPDVLPHRPSGIYEPVRAPVEENSERAVARQGRSGDRNDEIIGGVFA